MKTLHLNVTKEFFDMIQSGVKKEEYREIKPYWENRLLTRCSVDYTRYLINDLYYRPADFDLVEIKNGYQKNAPKLLFECKGIDIGKPNKEWIGAKFDGKDDVFIIKLGEKK